MGRPYSLALRARVLSPSLSHFRLPRLARASASTVRQSSNGGVAFVRRAGLAGPGIGGTRKAVLEPWREWLEERVNGRPDVTLAVLQAALPEKV